jgi:hypothetical protein
MSMALKHYKHCKSRVEKKFRQVGTSVGTLNPENQIRLSLGGGGVGEMKHGFPKIGLGTSNKR